MAFVAARAGIDDLDGRRLCLAAALLVATLGFLLTPPLAGILVLLGVVS